MWTRYLALGDSITEGVGSDVGDLPVRSWADWMVDAARSAGLDLTYRNVAVRGATSSDVLRTQVPEIGSFRPDLVSVTVGANDARRPAWTAEAFAAEYAEILGGVDRAGAQALIATYADVRGVIEAAGREIPATWRLYFDRMHEVNEVIRVVGARLGACLVDMESGKASDLRYLSADLTHPNALAYRLIGRVALETLAGCFGLPELNVAAASLD